MGGGIEFGETGAQALVREFKEEIDKDIIVDVFLGAVENIFEWQGQAGHEIILLYKCRFAASSDYGQDEIPRVDENPGYVHWKSIRDIEAENALLHPQQVFKRLKENNL